MLKTKDNIKEAVKKLFKTNQNENIIAIFEIFEKQVLKKCLSVLFKGEFLLYINAATGKPEKYNYGAAENDDKKTARNLVARYAYDQFNVQFKSRADQIYAKTLKFKFKGEEVIYTANAPTAGDEAQIGGWLGKVTELAKSDGLDDYKQSVFWKKFAEKSINVSDYKNDSKDIISLVSFKKYVKQHKDKSLKDLIMAKQKIVEDGIKNSTPNETKNNKFFIIKNANTKKQLEKVLKENYKELCVIDAMINLKDRTLLNTDKPKYDRITPDPNISIDFYKEDYYIKELKVYLNDSRLGGGVRSGAKGNLSFQTIYYIGTAPVKINGKDYLRIAAVDPKKVVSSIAPAAGGRGTRGARRKGIPSVAAPAAKAAAIVRYNLAKPVKDSRTDKLQTNILKLADGTDGTLAGTIGGTTGFSRKDLVDGKYSRITQIAVLNSLTQLRTEILELIKKTEDDAPPAPPIVNEKRIIKLAKLLENKLLGESTNLLLEEEKVSKKELIEFAKKLKDLEIKFKRQGGDLNQNIDSDEYKKDRFVDTGLVDEYNSILSNLVIKDRKIDYAASIKKIKAAEVKAAEDKAAAGAKGAVDAAGKRPLSVAPSQPYEVQCFNAKGTGSGESEMWEIDEAWSIATEGKMKFKPWYDLAMEIFKHNPQDGSFDYKRGRKAKYRAYLLSINTYRVAGDTLNVKCLPKFISPFVLQLFNDFIRARRMARKFEKAGNIKDLNQLKQDAKFFYSEDGKFESTFAYKVYKIGMDVVSFKNIEYLTQRQEKASKEDPNTPPPGAKGIKDARTTELIDQKLDAKLKALQGAENVKMGGLNTRSLPTQTTFNNKNYKLFTGK